jgi:hypothetical protein
MIGVMWLDVVVMDFVNTFVAVMAMGGVLLWVHVVIMLV